MHEHSTTHYNWCHSQNRVMLPEQGKDLELMAYGEGAPVPNAPVPHPRIPVYIRYCGRLKSDQSSVQLSKIRVKRGFQGNETIFPGH